MERRRKGMGRRLFCLLLTLCLLSGGTLRARAADATRHVNILAEDVNHCDIYYSEGNGLIPIDQGGTHRQGHHGALRHRLFRRAP